MGWNRNPGASAVGAAAAAAAAATGFVRARGGDRVKVSEPISENPYWICKSERAEVWKWRSGFSKVEDKTLIGAEETT